MKPSRRLPPQPAKPKAEGQYLGPWGKLNLSDNHYTQGEAKYLMSEVIY
jgi:hypothetical protein